MAARKSTRRHRTRRRRTHRVKRRQAGGQEAPMNNSMTRAAGVPIMAPLASNTINTVISNNWNMDGMNAEEVDAFLALANENEGSNNFPNNISEIPTMNEYDDVDMSAANSPKSRRSRSRRSSSRKNRK
jgi:hypothetical protein